MFVSEHLHKLEQQESLVALETLDRTLGCLKAGPVLQLQGNEFQIYFSSNILKQRKPAFEGFKGLSHKQFLSFPLLQQSSEKNPCN